MSYSAISLTCAPSANSALTISGRPFLHAARGFACPSDRPDKAPTLLPYTRPAPHRLCSPAPAALWPLSDRLPLDSATQASLATVKNARKRIRTALVLVKSNQSKRPMSPMATSSSGAGKATTSMVGRQIGTAPRSHSRRQKSAAWSAARVTTIRRPARGPDMLDMAEQFLSAAADRLFGPIRCRALRHRTLAPRRG